MTNKIPTIKETYKYFENYTDGYGYVAKMVLEKQMPKKPIQESMNCVVIQCCPTCRHMFFDASGYTSSDRYYCSSCGQKLDWENNNEKQ